MDPEFYKQYHDFQKQLQNFRKKKESEDIKRNNLKVLKEVLLEKRILLKREGPGFVRKGKRYGEKFEFDSDKY